MKKLVIAVMVLSLAGCTLYSGPYHETRTETVSDDGHTITRITKVEASGWNSEKTRSTDGKLWLDHPFYADGTELCAIAQAALRVDGDPGVVDSLLWDRDTRIGPDCTSAFAVAGIAVTGSMPNSMRRIMMPRQLSDGRVYVEIDSACVKKCQSGNGYAVTKRQEGWQAERAPVVSWTHLAVAQ
jgi:hypothetical protein